MTQVSIRFVFVGLCLVGASIVSAGDPAKVLPVDPRDESILSPADFFGFAIGSRHLRHDQVVAYWKYLAEASDRVTLIPYGQTHGERPLLAAAITAADNTPELETLRSERRKLASGKFQGDISDQLLVMYLGYSVHGDEASAVNAAPLVAYHLTSSESKEVTDWLAQGVFLVDPAINPDGIDRFANWANEHRGKFPSPFALDSEHIQPWPGGRTNYYWFDLNRDWLPLVNPESRGRLRLFHAWKPNVVLDFHEMSGTSSFFFQPGIPERNNPFSPTRNLELTRKFSAEHVRSMDAAGELFYTEERFDDFYVGKGSTYPDLHGAVGILFEQGSTRGLRLKNERTDRHFRDTVANQVRTSLSSLRVANAERSELLEFQTTFYRDALQAGSDDRTTAYLLFGTPSRLNAAAKLMRSHAIKVYRPQSELRYAGDSLRPENVLVVPCAQAEYTFIKSLMEPLQDFRENIFYDVSTWHLPSAFDLDMVRHQSDLPQSWLAELWTAKTAQAAPTAADGSLDATVTGYAFAPIELGVPKLVAALQRAGAHLRVTTEPMVSEIEGKQQQWPLGTYLLLKQPNVRKWEGLVQLAAKAAVSNGVTLGPLPSGFTASGPDLGSDTTLDIPICKPLLVVGAGTRSYSAGVLWHYLDIRLGQASTRVEAERLASVALHDFTCVILPEGSYGELSKQAAEHLSRYVRDGGTVIAVGSAIGWLERQSLIELAKESQAADTDVESPTSQDLQFGLARDARALESIAGAFLLTTVDPTHPLAFGFPDSEVPVFRDSTDRFPLPTNHYQTAATYNRVLAGYVSERNRRRLRGTAAAWVEPDGSGRYILLADNPVFRGYVRSSERFLSNAILLGPAIKIPAAPVAEGENESDDEHHH